MWVHDIMVSVWHLIIASTRIRSRDILIKSQARLPLDHEARMFSSWLHSKNQEFSSHVLHWLSFRRVWGNTSTFGILSHILPHLGDILKLGELEFEEKKSKHRLKRAFSEKLKIQRFKYCYQKFPRWSIYLAIFIWLFCLPSRQMYPVGLQRTFIIVRSRTRTTHFTFDEPKPVFFLYHEPKPKPVPQKWYNAIFILYQVIL